MFNDIGARLCPLYRLIKLYFRARVGFASVRMGKEHRMRRMVDFWRGEFLLQSGEHYNLGVHF